jgi:hypothetical protein
VDPASRRVHTVTMKAELVDFGVLELEGRRYTRDVVIDGGRISRRHKGRSKSLRERYGHTPLSLLEDIPWGGERLIVGTGDDGALPVDPAVEAEARRRGITIEALPTRDACRRLADLPVRDVYAILHVTC